MSNNILVTGGGGFLGLEIVKQLLDKGHKVTSLSRNHYDQLEKLGVKTIKADLTKKEDIENLDFSIYDCVFHVAALAGVWVDYNSFYCINYIGTRNLVDKCLSDNVSRFIYTSTPSVVFGEDDIVNGDESLDYPEKYYTHYAKTKSMAENYVKEKSNENFLTISIRPHLIWGEGDPHLIPRLKEKARSGRLKVVGDGENLVDVIHVSNAAHAHILAMESLVKKTDLSGNAYFVGQERPVNMWHFLNQILEVYKIDKIEDKISFSIAYYIGFVLEILYRIIGIKSPEPPMTRFIALQLAKSHYFSHAKAKNDLGYSPLISVEEGLLRLKEEYQKVEAFK